MHYFVKIILLFVIAFGSFHSDLQSVDKELQAIDFSIDFEEEELSSSHNMMHFFNEKLELNYFDDNVQYLVTLFFPLNENSYCHYLPFILVPPPEVV